MVAAIKLELVAAFVGIRNLEVPDQQRGPSQSIRPHPKRSKSFP